MAEFNSATSVNIPSVFSKSYFHYQNILHDSHIFKRIPLHNFLHRFLVNATLGSALNSPLESPDILQRFMPCNDIGPVTASMASVKLSADSINNKSQQVRLQSLQTNINQSYLKTGMATTSFIEMEPSTASFSGTTLESIALINSRKSEIGSTTTSTDEHDHGISKLNTIFKHPTIAGRISVLQKPVLLNRNSQNVRTSSRDRATSFLEFSLSSVGRSFIDESGGNSAPKRREIDSFQTYDNLELNLSPSTPSVASKSGFSETFSNDFMKPSTPSVIVSPLDEQIPKNASSNGGSWDLLELDLDFHHVNVDPSFGGDVQENLFFSDDPLGILPSNPTKPDSHDL